MIDKDSRYADCEVLADGSVGLRRTSSVPASPNNRSHVVVAGDRLDALAYRYYGDPTLWWVIADANAIAFPLDLKSNTVLQIPPASSLMT